MQMLQSRNPLGAKNMTVFEYGCIAATINPLGERSPFIYDINSRRFASVSPMRHRGSTVNHAAGKAVASITPIGLALGESPHLVDTVSPLENCRDTLPREVSFQIFQIHDQGRLSLPVWIDHEGSAGTRYATDNLEKTELEPPPRNRMPVISP